jgi:hypothetical protein
MKRKTMSAYNVNQGGALVPPARQGTQVPIQRPRRSLLPSQRTSSPARNDKSLSNPDEAGGLSIKAGMIADILFGIFGPEVAQLVGYPNDVMGQKGIKKFTRTIDKNGVEVCFNDGKRVECGGKEPTGTDTQAKRTPAVEEQDIRKKPEEREVAEDEPQQQQITPPTLQLDVTSPESSEEGINGILDYGQLTGTQLIEIVRAFASLPDEQLQALYQKIGQNGAMEAPLFLRAIENALAQIMQDDQMYTQELRTSYKRLDTKALRSYYASFAGGKREQGTSAAHHPSD